MVNERNPPRAGIHGRRFGLAVPLPIYRETMSRWAADRSVCDVLYRCCADTLLCLLAGRAAEQRGGCSLKADWRFAKQLRVFGGVRGAAGWRRHFVFSAEAPLLVVAAWIVLGIVSGDAGTKLKRWLLDGGWGWACCAWCRWRPWAVRNAVTLHEFQFSGPEEFKSPR